MVTASEEYNPLVSVAVITYNSAKTVLETLESIQNQTYQNLELIISDDCSKDETVSICRDWVETHKDRFVRTEIISVPQNTGTSANYNRAVDACLGDWIKEIDGDDILLPTCVSTYIEYVNAHANAIFVFAKAELFSTIAEAIKRLENRFNYDFFTWNKERQIEFLMLECNCIPSGTAFYNKPVICNKYGIRNDERIPLLEDWPKWINLLNAGVHFDFIDKVTIRYRLSEFSLSTSSIKSSGIIRSEQLLYKYYRFKYEYEHANKKVAIEKYLRAQKIVSQNVFWVIVFKLYKIVIMHKLH